ncbi:lipid A-modifier LpxR family protein [Stagnihabitans tardus]|uniref:lipid A-modifier LpxR family protein n=1 Tax=Stagnihabitans tardus TaxID=2699202 RepID=UPI00338DD108
MKKIGKALVLALAATLTLAAPQAAHAEGKVVLGWGRMFNNDAIGDGHDRWRTGSYTLSVIRAPSFTGDLPVTMGELLEWRLSTQIVAPANLSAPAPGDRRYAGMLSVGVHSQSLWQGMELDLGGDLVAIGPMTGVSRVQKWVHNALGIDEPNTSQQITDRVIPTVSAELARPFELGGAVLRPFVAAQAGVETFARIGADVTLGAFGRQSVMVRDGVTGQRYRAAPSVLVPGFSLVAGGDLTRVFDSVLLPSNGPAPTDTRSRLRAGVHWQGARASAFYGLTWLSEEFQGQGSGQLLGSLSFNLRF